MGKRGILGIALGSRKDDEVHIEIDINNWREMDELQRTTTMYHELSHDLLNAAHVDNDEHLMHPTYLFESTADLILAMMDVFKEYKNGRLTKFEDVSLTIPFDRTLPPLTSISN